MLFNDLLAAENIDPAGVLALRHTPWERGLRKVLPWLAAEHPDIFNIASAVIATPKPAEARCIGCWVGAGIAAGVVAGALASRSYGYGYPAYGYGYGGYGYGYPAYGYAPYAYAPTYYGGYGPRRYYARRYYRY